MDLGMPPGLAALVLQAQVIFTVVIAAGVLRERPTRPQVLGVALGSLGLVVVAVGRGGHVPSAPSRSACSPPSRGGSATWSRAPRGHGRTVVDRLVGGGVPIPLFALSLLLDGPTPSPTPHVTLLAGSFHGLHRGTRVARRLRDLQRPAQRNQSSSVVPWVLLAPVVAMASAWSLLVSVRPRVNWWVAPCWSWACWSRCAGKASMGSTRGTAHGRPACGTSTWVASMRPR